MKKGEVVENCYRKKGKERWKRIDIGRRKKEKERWKRIDIGRRKKNDRRLKMPMTTNKEGEK